MPDLETLRGEPATGAAPAPVRPAAPSTGARSLPWPVLLAALATLVGFLLRLPQVGDSLFADELSTYSIVVGQSPGQIVHTLAGHSVDLTPPLSYLLAWPLSHLGPPQVSLRLLPIAAGTALIPAVYALGRLTLGRWTGALGAALAACSPFLVYYSGEARAYPLVVLLGVLAAVAVLLAVRDGRRRWWAAYAVLACAAMYTHLTVVFVLGALFLWTVLARPAARRPLVVSTALAALAYVPWLPAIKDNLDSPGAKLIEALEPLTPHNASLDLTHWAVGSPVLPLGVAPGRPGAALIALGLLVALVGAGLAARPHLARWRGALAAGARSGLGLLVVLALAQPVGFVLHSFVAASVWDRRNLISSLPAFLLLLAALAVHARGRLRLVAAALLVAGLLVGTVRSLDRDWRRPDYLGAAAFVERHSAPTDPVVEVQAWGPGPYSPFGDAALRDLAQPGPRARRPVWRVGSPSLHAVETHAPYAPLLAPPVARTVAAATAAAHHGRVLLFVPQVIAPDKLAVDGPPVTVNFARRMERRGYRITGFGQFPGFEPCAVYVFERRA